ncbi:T9SS type A sorting domain-containing protein [Dyadobacter aurulentus]|uniref:T9SS type A sorting domain-containing protein n=1 Tax=Dyadobacter sp. UC 10 TaxID=2605428 RepID=UPI0011F1674A|nr:T9SS type A sorting domain-containing protein [Dyadobacter sp. UC 10]KAA0990475.1 T9SS type A sorting domain-containing protein [Dyadobacter sp. UC 10]
MKKLFIPHAILVVLTLSAGPGFCQKLTPKTQILHSNVNGGRISLKATKNIVAYKSINSGSVDLIAGQEIAFRPGFHVANGSFLHAKIEEVESLNNQTRLEEHHISELDKAVINISSYPNPFESSVQIDYWLPTDNVISIELITVSGQRIRQLVEAQHQGKGLHQVKFDSKSIPSGAYMCVLKTPDERLVRKIVKK